MTELSKEELAEKFQKIKDEFGEENILNIASALINHSFVNNIESSYFDWKVRNYVRVKEEQRRELLELLRYKKEKTAQEKLDKITEVLRENGSCCLDDLLETDDLYLTERGLLARDIWRVIKGEENASK